MDIKILGLLIALAVMIGGIYLEKSGWKIELPSLPSLPVHSSINFSAVGNGTMELEGKSEGWARFNFPAKADLGGLNASGEVEMLISARVGRRIEGKVSKIRKPLEIEVDKMINFTLPSNFSIPFSGKVDLNGQWIVEADGKRIEGRKIEIKGFRGMVSPGRVEGEAAEIVIDGKVVVRG